MLNIKKVRNLLQERGIDTVVLEDEFKAKLDYALENFSDAKEAREWVRRSEENWLIDRRMEYAEDMGTGRGLGPMPIWKKQCRYCKTAFETRNRRQAYCDSPGHRQQYHERKKSALLYLEVIKICGIGTE